MLFAEAGIDYYYWASRLFHLRFPDRFKNIVIFIAGIKTFISSVFCDFTAFVPIIEVGEMIV